MKVSISPDGEKWLDIVCQTEDIITVKYIGNIDGWHEFESFDKVYKFVLSPESTGLFEIGKEYQIRFPL